ncbi:hypothetical protein NC653_028900 [Populus alba x Populus x berolinensis]|uniref:Uncharacterized protein n=1 Tax=Populus alba x Populus x berolinensis TaxID=444605 RepID=A0AAD6Q2K3_9ROSI|nr:hypothetical protein NC653_028900 [Populus alba x Populus x berolinensis]
MREGFDWQTLKRIYDVHLVDASARLNLEGPALRFSAHLPIPQGPYRPDIIMILAQAYVAYAQ